MKCRYREASKVSGRELNDQLRRFPCDLWIIMRHEQQMMYRFLRATSVSKKGRSVVTNILAHL